VAGAVGVTINGSPLTLAQYKDGTLIKTGTDVWTFVGSSAAPGMDLITPTSVAGSGVTLSGGHVSFSAATAVSLNGCFASTYDNYQIVVRYQNSAATPVIFVRLRLSGTDAITNYQYQNLDASNTSITGGRYTAQAEGLVGTGGAAGNPDELLVMNVSGPALAAQTSFFCNNTASTSSIITRIASMRHTTATAYDGFTIYPSSGNLTGTLRVYGLRNS
jgi:hypothetical protein